MRRLGLACLACGRIGFGEVSHDGAVDTAVPPDVAMECPVGGMMHKVGTATGAAGVILDDTTVYWASSDAGEIHRTLKSGAGSDELIASGLQFPSGLAIVGRTLYFTTWSSNTIEALNLDTLTRTPISANAPGARGVVVDGATVYATLGSTAFPGTSTAIVSVPVTGSTTLMPVAPGLHAFGLTLYNNLLYYSDASAGTVNTYSLTTKMTQVIASGFTLPLGCAVDAQAAYCIDAGATVGAGTIYKMPPGGGTPVPFLTSLQGPWFVAIDTCNIYWGDHSLSEIDVAPR
jgi:hypothetical protein